MGIHIMPPLFKRHIPVTTLTVISTASDGYFFHYNTDYSTVHDAASANVVDDTSPSLRVGQRRVATWSQRPNIWRGALFFDTSALPAGAVITAAKLRLYLGGVKNDNDFDLVVVRGTNLNDPIVASDYGDLLAETVSRGKINSADIPVTAYYDIVLNALGRAEISKTGTTKFGLRSSRDISSLDPGNSTNEYLDCFTNEYGSGYQPELVIEYQI